MSSSHAEYVLDWNEHGNNFSLSFEELLQANKLVDVQLVAEGHLISAHRLVLSAMSTYFCKMFTQMPAHQQAFVFLQGISKQTMEGLMTYIYRGQVNVKQDCLDEFMNAAIALNIKGLADGSYSQSFDSRPSYATPAGPSYSGSAFQTPNFSQSFGSAGVQYRSVQRSADATCQYQQPMKEYEQQNGFYMVDNNEMDGHFDSNYGQNHGEGGGSARHSMNGRYDQWESLLPFKLDVSADNSKSEVLPITAKRQKSKISLSAYDHPADIQTINGRQNLYHKNFKFCKHSEPSPNRPQRWKCTRTCSEKCGSVIHTMEINGVIMMKITKGEHTHEP